jgi:putative membrane protein insertion efficiency factor
MKFLMMPLIRLYQRTLSPDHGPLKFLYPNGYCKFHPTCSEYSYQAFSQHGFMKASLLTVQRILHCNPWSQSGLDPVPEPSKKAV